MKVIAVNGSARKNGNTDILIRTVSEELQKEGIETVGRNMAFLLKAVGGENE